MQNIRSRAGGCRAASLFVVSFLLSCLTMGTSAAGAQSQAAHPKSAFDREATSYRLTMPKVSAMTRVWRGLHQLGPEGEAGLGQPDNESDAADDSTSDSESTGQWLAKLEAQVEGDPKLKSIFTRAGITPREYLLTMGAWMVADPHFGAGRAITSPTPAQRANIAFIQAHQGEFENVFAEFKAMNADK